ncbi:MAG: type II secretion system F family protein [Gemmatimonadales bacterium]|jgi:type IV pilus assembly protein PilC|nr:MAG: type II secretion system F family protein [Gemmatimonadales bacterium]
MPTFTYSARPAAGGDIRSGEVDLKTRDEVMAYLHRQKLIPVAVREKPKEFSISFGSGVSTREIVIFTRQFATMINAGLPLVQSLDILAEQTENPKLQKVIKDVLYDVESGNTLADAMEQHPKVFTKLFVSMVAAGEAGGILDTILLRLATFLEKNDALARKIKGAMIYPGVIVGVAVAAVAILLIFVIPTFQTMFASAGVPLPLPTQIVITMSALLQAWWWAILLAIGAALFALRTFYRTEGGERVVDGILLKLPILGNVQRKAAVARFTRTLGTLVSSGVAILEGLEITAKTAGNRVIQDAVMDSRASIAGGDTISGPLKQSGVFPPMVVQMINVGEQTGGLDEMLSKIADFYDEEVDAAVSALLAAMEPIMIVVLGVVVGGMIVAMYLPIFDMVSAVG